MIINLKKELKKYNISEYSLFNKIKSENDFSEFEFTKNRQKFIFIKLLKYNKKLNLEEIQCISVDDFFYYDLKVFFNKTNGDKSILKLNELKDEDDDFEFKILNKITVKLLRTLKIKKLKGEK